MVLDGQISGLPPAFQVRTLALCATRWTPQAPWNAPSTSLRGRFVLLLVATVGFGGSVHAQDDTATYEVTFRGNWTLESTPGGVVGGAHFTTLIGAVHNSSVSFWSVGGTASTGVENMAELGITSTLRSEIRG